MKNKIQSFVNKFLVITIITTAFYGCGEYFKNPLQDKETGEDINLLLVDFNFFTTRMTFKLNDAVTGEPITTNAEIKFTGTNSDDIITYAGEKKPDYYTSEGQLELTVDPNVNISESSPFEFAVNIDIDGYNSLSKGFSIQSDGIKTFELSLVKTTDEEENEYNGDIDFEEGDTTFTFFSYVSFKSANEESKPYKINHTTSLSSIVKFLDSNGNPIFTSSSQAYQAYLKDPGNFIKVSISSFSSYEPGIDIVSFDGEKKVAQLHKLETGKLTKLVIDGKLVANLNGGTISSVCSDPDNFLPQILNFITFEDDHWNLLGVKAVHSNLNFSYTLAIVSEEDLCATGSQINFKAPFNSAFAIDADVYDMNDKLVTTMTFKGKFPKSFTVENVPQEAVKMVFRNNNPSFAPIETLTIDNFCTGSYDINVSAAEGYDEFQIVLTAICPDNLSVGIAPTYSGEIRIKDSGDYWQGLNMEGGVVDILGKPNADYELRLLWENEWEYSYYSTKFDANGNYIGAVDSRAEIKSKTLDDGRIQVNIVSTFDQNICDDMNW